MAHGCKCQEKCIADEWLLSGNLRGSDAAAQNVFDEGKKYWFPHVNRTHIRIKAGQDLSDMRYSSYIIMYIIHTKIFYMRIVSVQLPEMGQVVM